MKVRFGSIIYDQFFLKFLWSSYIEDENLLYSVIIFKGFIKEIFSLLDWI